MQGRVEGRVERLRVEGRVEEGKEARSTYTLVPFPEWDTERGIELNGMEWRPTQLMCSDQSSFCQQ